MKSLMALAIAMATTLCGCHSVNKTTEKTQLADSTEPHPVEMVAPVEGGTHSALPRAVVYKMNGDYINNVPVTVSADGQTIISYPAPTDLTPGSTPLPMDDGYYLDRRGINANTRFLRLTYDEYRALRQAPTLEQLRSAIIPDARVIDIHRLPLTLNEALSDPNKVNQLINEFK